MKFKVFTIYDSKAETYLQPFCMKTKGEAIRAFTDTVNSPNHQFNQHSSDFTLFELGEYDDQTGFYAQHKTHISLGLASEFKRNLEVVQ